MDNSRISDEMEKQKKRGVLLVLTGPTAVGKDTIMQLLLKRNPKLVRLVTTTSRPKRPQEVEGTDYYFVEIAEFEKLMSEGAFLEWVEYLGHYKGTQMKHLKQALATGHDVIWRIDVRGVKNIKQRVIEMAKDPQFPVCTPAFVFLTVPDLDTLKKRMEKRATENETVQQQGLDLAKWEMDQYDDSDFLVVNEEDKEEETAEKVEKIMEAERHKINKLL